jgi:hypothetical protein
MQRKIIELEAIIGSVRSKVDKSLSLSLSTPELSPTDMAEIMNLQGMNLLVRITPSDEPNAPILTVEKGLNSKSQSQRIRSVLYLLWKRSDKSIDFEGFYKMQTEKYIEAIKEKLD